MKKLFLILVTLSSVSAFATTSQLKVDCNGVTSDGSKKIGVKTNDTADELAVTIYPAGREPQAFDTISYPIVDSLPMFPVASIHARRDMRPVDGALSDVYLAISNEIVLGENDQYPSLLTIKSTSYRGREEKEVTENTQYDLGCKMENNL